MTPIEAILSGVVISVVSGSVGALLGTKGKVKNGVCKERREACTAVLCNKLDNIKEGLVEVRGDVKKLLGQPDPDPGPES